MYPFFYVYTITHPVHTIHIHYIVHIRIVIRKEYQPPVQLTPELTLLGGAGVPENQWILRDFEGV